MASEWVTKEDYGITDDDYCDNVFKIKGNILLQCLESQLTQRRRKLLLASNEKLKQEMWEVKTCTNKWKRFTNDVCSIL